MRNLRRLLTLALSFALAWSVTLGTVFASSSVVDDLKTGANVKVMVSAENDDCKVLSSVPASLQVRITAADSAVDVEVPVQRVEEVAGGYALWVSMDDLRLSDAVMEQLAALQGEVDLGAFTGDLDAVLREVDGLFHTFQVEVIGLPAGHYAVEHDTVVLTSEMVQAAIDLLKDAMEKEGETFTSFSDLITSMLADIGMTLDELFDTSAWTEADWEALKELGITPETMDTIRDLMYHIDDVIAYLTGDAFSGILISDVTLTCDCPVWWYYQLQHRYYVRENGKLRLVDTVKEGDWDSDLEDYYLRAEKGTVIRAADFCRTQHDGKTWKYLGSYDDTILYDESGRWADYAAKELTVGEDAAGVTGLVLRYVYDADAAAAPAQTTAPLTGDETPLGGYLAVLIAALAAMAVLVRRRIGQDPSDSRREHGCCDDAL